MTSEYGPVLQFQNALSSLETWSSLSTLGFPDYEISDIGRVRCIKDRKGYKAPFFPATKLRNKRPTIVLRNAQMQQVTHRIDELVLQTFIGPRPAPDYGPVPTNGDLQDLRLDNLTWQPGQVAPKPVRRKKTRAKKAAPVKVSKEVKHGHWLGIGNVMVSIQPNRVVELTVADSQDHHSIPATDLDDVIRVLQAAKKIVG